MSTVVPDDCEEAKNRSNLKLTQTLYQNKKNVIKRVAYNLPETTSKCNANVAVLNKQKSMQTTLQSPRKTSPSPFAKDQIRKPVADRNLKTQRSVRQREPLAQQKHSIAVNTIITGAICSSVSPVVSRKSNFGKDLKKKISLIATKVQTISNTIFTLDKASNLSLDLKSCGTQIFDFSRKPIGQTRSQGTVCEELVIAPKTLVAYSNKYTLVRPVIPDNNQRLSNPIRWAVSHHPVQGPDF